ncbi:hypothetical protein LOZ53_002163 [Ophidiomyces ophidiicola]|nr:hypothetical protein LOZ55_003799 [Ophidiomyces ophidiicola]KAI1984548.1 hypothetical protein LOZ51_006626 [Ophidiomyces ophidiicola]KAI1991243.1 hypothetical protein LOZ54_002238 [Ophidiomyces ophidiicola]KAI1993395.1 hypothetical protein LOZ53_002163 [Ophidiomyces ophidiicola]
MFSDSGFIKQIIFLSFQLFINGFGLYQNMYKSLIRFYLISAELCAAEQRRQNNVYIIAFNSHAINFPNMINVLGPEFQALEKDFDVHVTDEEMVQVVALCLMFLENMPQQNDNAELKKPTAVCFCQSCNVTETQQFNMLYNIVFNDHYHHQLLHL